MVNKDGGETMTNKQPQQRYEIGMVGLGVMGRNLMLNMADHGCAVAGYDKDQTKVEALRKESAERNIRGAANILDFIALLRKPRAIMMLVPAGAPVDSVIKDLLPHLDKGDLITFLGSKNSGAFLFGGYRKRNINIFIEIEFHPQGQTLVLSSLQNLHRYRNLFHL
jgi:ketol-acid reductoisomerase